MGLLPGHRFSSETVERFARTARMAAVRIFEQSAHLTMLTERDEYVAAIRAFLRKHEP